MFTEKQIWGAIDALAKSRGFSPSGLAIRSGLDKTSFNPSKRTDRNGRARWPSTETLNAIGHATGCTLEEFCGFIKEAKR